MSTLVSAFAGNSDAQASVLSQGQYVLLSKTDRSQWDMNKLTKVFEATDETLYTTRR